MKRVEVDAIKGLHVGGLLFGDPLYLPHEVNELLALSEEGEAQCIVDSLRRAVVAELLGVTLREEEGAAVAEVHHD